MERCIFMENLDLTNVIDVISEAMKHQEVLMSYSEAYGGE